MASVNSEQIEIKTLEIVNAGDHWSFRMSRQIAPLLAMLQWYIRVRNVIFGGLNGYSWGNTISKKKIPP